MQSCENDQTCRNQVQTKYEVISKPRDEEFKKVYEACDKNGQCGDLKKIHYDLRQKLTDAGNIYYQEHPEEFEKLPGFQSIYHTFVKNRDGSVNTFGENNNIKYIHPILGYEIVLDQNRSIITDPLNAGTYNFYNPSNNMIGGELIGGFVLHNKLDIRPYDLLGNSPYDPTTPRQRFWRAIELIK